jgi:5-methylcytosine-specific restriction enzyme B
MEAEMPDQADTIREYVFQKYIEPARKQKIATVKVRAGDVAKALGLRKRMPAVCGAIGTVKFRTKYSVQLVNRQGPGNGSNATFVFEV